MKALGPFLVRFGMPAVLAVVASSPVVCLGGSFTVDSVSSFQAALATAQNNGADDVITVAMGTYSVSSTLTYSSAEPYSLTITGAGIGLTVLDGGSVATPLPPTWADCSHPPPREPSQCRAALLPTIR